jgi:hypothetical protein
MVRKIGIFVIFAAVIFGAVLGLTACKNENNTDNGGTDAYKKFELTDIMDKRSESNIAWALKFNGTWYDNGDNLQSVLDDFFSSDEDENEDEETIIYGYMVAGEFYMPEDISNYIKYGGTYYADADRETVIKIGGNYYENSYITRYRTGTEGNYTYSDTYTANATAVRKHTKLTDGTVEYFVIGEYDYSYYCRFGDGVFISEDDYYNLTIYAKFGDNEEYYAYQSIYTGEIKYAIRAGEDGEYTYYTVDMGLKFTENMYYALNEIELYYKAK